MAGGVVAALKAQGLAGKVPVSGQDGDKAALNRVALGTQTVSVWKDARELGKAAGEAAIALCKDKDITKVRTPRSFTTPKNDSMTSTLLTPVPITKDNLRRSSTPSGSPRTPCARTFRPGPSRPAADALRKLCALLRGSAAAQGAFLFRADLTRRRDERGRPGHHRRTQEQPPRRSPMRDSSRRSRSTPGCSA